MWVCEAWHCSSMELTDGTNTNGGENLESKDEEKSLLIYLFLSFMLYAHVAHDCPIANTQGPSTACAKLLTCSAVIQLCFFFFSLPFFRCAFAGSLWILRCVLKTSSSNFWIFITVFRHTHRHRSPTPTSYTARPVSAATLLKPSSRHTHTVCAKKIVFEVHEPKNYLKHFCYIWLINCDR